MDRLIIGVDESGTGAWAGPFTVTAFAAYESCLDALVEAGATDSKKLSAKQRDARVFDLCCCAFIAQTIFVEPTYLDQRKAWREAVAQAVKHCFSATKYDLTGMEVYIDGNEDVRLTEFFSRVWLLEPKYFKQGETKWAPIGAASILAKSQRSARMRELHQQYPMYGWDENDGYGTEKHMEAIFCHGITPQHRRIKNLAHYFEEQDAKLPNQNPAHRGAGIRSTIRRRLQ